MILIAGPSDGNHAKRVPLRFRNKVDEARVECRQAAAVADCCGQQHRVRNRPVPLKARENRGRQLDHGSIEGSECMGFQVSKTPKQSNRVGGGHGVPDHCRVAGNPDESGFSQRTRRPTACSLPDKPAPGGVMMNVIGPRESNQDVDIEQRRQGHSSSAP